MGEGNQYHAAIAQVGEIVEAYDYDRMFPVFGYGGVPHFMGDKKVNHCFPLTGSLQNCEVQGIAGILKIYQDTISKIQLAGPTFFNPILQGFKHVVQKSQGTPAYPILLLITDGAIHDMKETKRTIVDLSSMACSIIIVGVGQADFSAMRELDGDGPGGLKDDQGRTVDRDIVQFVPFRETQNLAEEVLAEIPTQFESFMKKHNIQVNYTAQQKY